MPRRPKSKEFTPPRFVGLSERIAQVRAFFRCVVIAGKTGRKQAVKVKEETDVCL